MKIYCFVAILLCPWGLQAQIKNKYVDKNNSSRTTVIKEKTANDYQILEEQFGDAKLGEVVHITTAVEKKEKPPKKKPEPRVPVKKEQVKKKKEYDYINPSERVHGPPPPKTYAKKKRWKPKKRKAFRGNKKYSCFSF